METEIASYRERQALITLERQQHEADKADSIKARTQIELLIRDIEDTSARNEIQRESMQADLEALQADIDTKEAGLMQVEPEFEETLQEEVRIKAALEQSEAKQGTLFAKQGRASQFRTQSERDKYLRNECSKSRAYRKGRETTLEDVRASVKSTMELLGEKKRQEEELKVNLEKRKENVVGFSEELNGVRKRAAELNEKRKEGWKEESKLEQTVRHAREELGKAQRTLYTAMDRVGRAARMSERSQNVKSAYEFPCVWAVHATRPPGCGKDCGPTSPGRRLRASLLPVRVR